MNSDTNTDEINEIENATETMKGVLNALVPPDQIEITDIFGDKHVLPATCSARSQIKIVRMIEDIKDIAVPEGATGLTFVNSSDLIKLLGSLITNDKVFETICKCVEIAHPKFIKKLKEKASSEGVDFEEDLPVADLLSIEEAIASIVPLFLRIARRTGQAIGMMAEATNQ